jgi:hypothetical protein
LQINTLKLPPPYVQLLKRARQTSFEKEVLECIEGRRTSRTNHGAS